MTSKIEELAKTWSKSGNSTGVASDSFLAGARAVLAEAEKLRRDYGGVYVDAVSIPDLRQLFEDQEEHD